LISYPRGWAWQQSYLSQRLAALRSQPQTDSNNSLEDHDDDEQHPNHDRLLLFQHDPVYTLGRGADESHITFLQNDDERRHLLSRKVRGPGTARLTFDERASRMINQESDFKSRMATIVDQMAGASFCFSRILSFLHSMPTIVHLIAVYFLHITMTFRNRCGMSSVSPRWDTRI
jgi:hypothetical protein